MSDSDLMPSLMVPDKQKNNDEELSCLGAKWFFLQSNHENIRKISSSFDLPWQIAHILETRGVGVNRIENFFDPKIKHEMPDPNILMDMEKAVNFIGKSVLSQKKIGVFGDYDVDGGTSSALLYRFFNMIGIECFVHIPDRFTEGYGPNIEAFLKLQKMGAECLITVDCGSSASQVIKEAKTYGISTVILDHHLTYSATEGAEATVNPNRSDDISGLNYLTAAGVCFLFCVALTRFLSINNYFSEKIEKPNLMSLLDLVALGTVCDVAPLVDLNRAFVAQGLKIMEKASNIGLHHLANVGQITGKFSSYHCGFVLGPRINAGGRVGLSATGFKLLTTDCPVTAKELSQTLNHYNQERRTIEEQVKHDVLEQIERENLNKNLVIIASNTSWHTGVVGIVASRVKEIYNKPCFILGSDDGVILKGSGRSITGVNIGDAVKKALEKEYILSGGGHHAAAGLSVCLEKLPLLQLFLNEFLAHDIQKYGGYKIIKIDSMLTIQAANHDFLCLIEKLAPFGQGNPTPILCIENAKITYTQIIADKHIKLRFNDGQQSLNAICFNAINTPLDRILLQKNNVIDIVGTLKQDNYHTGNGVQFIIDDARQSLKV